MKKIFTVITAFLLMLTLGATSAFAYGEDTDAKTYAEDAEITQIGEADSIPDSDSNDTDNVDPEDPSDEGSSAWADEAYSLAVKNADKIFALLACISSLLVGFAYKKGLIPLVKNALSALAGGVSSLKEQTEKAEEITNGALTEAKDKLDRAEECFKTISERLASLESELDLAREGSMKDNELRLILNAQIDMMYELFMSSALPSYQKDSIGVKVAEMKRALNGITENG